MRCAVLLVLLSSASIAAFARQREEPPAGNASVSTARQLSDAERSEAEKVFLAVRTSLNTTAVPGLSSLLAPVVDLTLLEGARGSFSSEQATQLLTRFFADRRVTAFTYDRFAYTSPAPFASGSFQLGGAGRRQKVRVYVALSRTEKRWSVTQFSLY